MNLSRRAFASGWAPALLRAQPRKPPVDVLRPPDYVAAYTPQLVIPQAGGDVRVRVEPSGKIVIEAPQTELWRVHLRWKGKLPGGWRYLGDAWERSYGELEWRGSAPNRVMPWYFLVSNGSTSYGYGVKVQPAAFCYWLADPEGISLWLDLRCGGSGLLLGERRLEAATIVSVEGGSPFSTAGELCHRLCERPRLPAHPVYGWNNWYYTYGKGFAAADIEHESQLVSSLSPSGANRPYFVIDMGWEAQPEGAGPWMGGGAGFPDMAGLAAKMRTAGVRPALWVRPLYTREKAPSAWLLPPNRLNRPLKEGFHVLDPSVPEALEHIRQNVRRIRGWGYDLIKHDFTTFELFGRWGFEMGVALTNSGWHFAARSKTTAEVVLDLYRGIREAAGDALLIGCNTIGHLGAGLFELQRIGDDNSGRDWHRTRRMGVNTLAFRMPQHGTFFAADADCAPITSQVPWGLSKRWLDLLARSGTPLFVSADPKAIPADQRAAIKEALAAASRVQSRAEPLDWMESLTPRRWRVGGRAVDYNWFGEDGVSPFST